MKNNCIYLFALLALLPVMVFRDYTPGNELRYLSIADEALRNGTFFAFTNQGIPYADKPPLYFWLIMLSKSLLGKHAMWLLSFFSLLPAWVVVRTMNRWADGEIYKEFHPTATWMMLTCGLFLGAALFLRPDMLMCMFIILSLYTFYRMLKGEGDQRLNAWLFPVYIFLGIFSKGPVALLIPLLSTFFFLLLTNRVRSFGRYWGWKTWGVLLGGCLLWFGCVYMEGGIGYLDNLLFHQTVDRAVNACHHREPFYYYAVTIWYSLLPWSLLIIGVITTALWWRHFHSELQKFFLTVLVVTFVMLSCVSSKIEIYLLPVYPFFVYLTAMQLSRFRWNRWLAMSVALPAIAFCLSVPILVCLGGQKSTCFLADSFLYAAAGALTLSGANALYDLYYWKSLSKSVHALAFGIFCAVFVGGFALSKLNNQWGYGNLCREAMHVAKKHAVSCYCTYEVHRAENMDVFLQKDVRMVMREELLSGTLHGVVVILPLKELATLRKIVPEKEIHIVGDYGFALLPR